MISLVSSQVRFRRTGSWARAFQKFVTLSILRVALMSSYTARTAGLALSYSMKPRVDMVSAPRVDSRDRRNRSGIARDREQLVKQANFTSIGQPWPFCFALPIPAIPLRFRAIPAIFRDSVRVLAATYPLSFC